MKTFTTGINGTDVRVICNPKRSPSSYAERQKAQTLEIIRGTPFKQEKLETASKQLCTETSSDYEDEEVEVGDAVRTSRVAMYAHVCAYCGEDFVSANKDAKYCCRSCASYANNKVTEHVCVVCGKTFAGRRNAKYCSDKCRMKLYRETREQANLKLIVKKICPACGTEFETRKTNKIYCGSDCSKKAIKHRRAFCKQRYALYRGNELLDTGTANELAERRDCAAKTIQFMSTPSFRKRISTDNAVYAVKIGGRNVTRAT
jgi:predicted nucleic acid-binding Zn ribbon protein